MNEDEKKYFNVICKIKEVFDFKTNLDIHTFKTLLKRSDISIESLIKDQKAVVV